MIPKLK